MNIYVVQMRDLSEGNGALWSDATIGLSDKNEARRFIIAKRNSERDSDIESMVQYRIVILNSDAYYSQPTDCLEY